jgi:transposase
MPAIRQPYSSDVTDAEWEFCAPYLTLMIESAPQRRYALREVFNALRYFVRAGCPWRLLPHDLPPWRLVQEQALRWQCAGCFENMAHDLRALLRLLSGRTAEPSAAIFDSRTLQSSPESGGRAGYDGYKRRNGSKLHAAVDILGHLLAMKTTPANEQDRAQVRELCERVKEVTGGMVEVGYADQGYTGAAAAADAAAAGIRLEVVKLAEAKKGFVLLPKRWVVERSFGWAARFRRLARDFERLAASLENLHWLAFTSLMLASLFRC